MRAGQLRHRVTLETPVETQSASGQVVTTWTPVATRWAAVEPLAGRERFLAQQVHAEVDHRVRLRYLPGVTPKMRVIHRGRALAIVAPPINLGERNRELELLCTEQP